MGVTDNGLNILMDRLVNGGNYSAPANFKVGIGQTAFNVGDTDVEIPIPVSGTEQVDDCDAITGWTDSTDMSVSVNSSTFKQGNGSLNLTKDGTTEAGVNTYKTTTSLDFTDKFLSLWIYIIDAAALAKLDTTAVTIRFGSDASNYYQWTESASNLATGWNLLSGLTSANATITGTPTLTDCAYTYIELTSTGAAISWSIGDFIMDDIKLASADDFLGDFEVSYPSVDETNKEITYRATLTSVDANGYPLGEIGIVNADASPTLWSRDVFTPISKSNTEEVRFIKKDIFSAN